MANCTSNFKSLSTKKIKGPVLSKVEGFTLIEVLIVITLVGMLSIPVMGNYFKTQQRARDAVRKHDISEISNALEEYYAICGFSYPSGSYAALLGGARISCAAPVVTFMSKIPKDPKSGGNYYCSPSGTCNTTQYQICGTLEAEVAPTPTGFCLSNRQ